MCHPDTPTRHLDTPTRYPNAPTCHSERSEESNAPSPNPRLLAGARQTGSGSSSRGASLGRLWSELQCVETHNIIMGMNTFDQESPDAIVEFLDGSLRAVHAALDHGVSEAENLPPNLRRFPHHYASTIRTVARDSLENCERDGWELSGSSANSSIEFTKGNVVCRVHMSQNGQPPHPGHSGTRRAFYDRPSQLSLAFDTQVVQTVKLILHYRVTPHQELVLELCRPLRPWNYGDTAEVEWRRRIVIGPEFHDSLRFQPTDGDIEIEGEDLEQSRKSG